MSQTGYIGFLLLAAFAFYVTAKGKLGKYVSFFTTSGSDATAPVPANASSGNKAQSSSSNQQTGSLDNYAQYAGYAELAAEIFA